MYDVLGLLAQHFNGESTINSLRIGNYIGLKSIYQFSPTTNKDMSQVLGISPPTVTRIVSGLIESGYVVESVHPDDGRVRLIAITTDHPLENAFEGEMRAVLHEFLNKYDEYRSTDDSIEASESSRNRKPDPDTSTGS
jgi:hypothetical protein